MGLMDELAERHIQRAAAAGAFDDLPGQGQPLELEDDTLVPESLRAGYRLLKNSGWLPPELELRREVESVEQLLAACEPGFERDRLGRKLRLLRLRLAETRKT